MVINQWSATTSVTGEHVKKFQWTREKFQKTDPNSRTRTYGMVEKLHTLTKGWLVGKENDYQKF